MQTILKKISICLPALLLAFTFVTVTPAFALEDESGDDNPQVTTSESHKNRGDKHLARTSDDTDTETRKSSKRDAASQKRCEGKKHGVQNRFENIVNKSQKIHDKITTIYGKGTAFATTSNLQPADYDVLVAVADAAKAKSQASIDTLEKATPTIDCSNTDIAGSVNGFKTASKNVKTDLKDYRTAVKAVFKSVRAAAEAAKTEGGTQ